MQVYRYPGPLLLIDAARASFGLLVTFGPLLTVTVGRPLAIVLGAFGTIFLWFGLRVLCQAFSSIVLSVDGIACRGWASRFLAWNDLKGLKLAYYTPMRRQHAGWYQLTLMGRRQSIRLESTLYGFDEVVHAALAAATKANLTFDPATSENLAALGHRRRLSPDAGSATGLC